MWKIISVSLIALTAIMVNLLLYLDVRGSADSDTLNSELSVVESTARNNSVPNVSNEIEVPIRDNEIDRLVEIVLTSQDVKNADTKLTIGSSVPYNTKYITDPEVKESILRIMGKDFSLDSIEEEYLKHIVTLRHVEMAENVTEDNSKVKPAIDEYNSKLKQQEVPKAEGAKESETGDEIGFVDDPYGVINDTMQDLTNGDGK